MNINNILEELSYRIDTGIVDLTKEEQVTKLKQILIENKVPDANELAQKARVYFSYLNEINEAAKKGDAGLEAAAAFFKGKTYKNSKGNDVAFTTAIGYNDDSDSAHTAAMDDFESFLDANKGQYGSIEKAKQPEPKKPAVNIFGKDTGGKVFEPNPEPTSKSNEPTVPTEKPVSTTDDENLEGTYDENNKLQRNVVEAKNSAELMSALEELGQAEEKLMFDKVVAGPGGPVASAGETLCTEAQTDLIDGTYNPKEVRNTPIYKAEYDTIKKDMTGTDKRKITSTLKELQNICNKMGYYDENGKPDFPSAIAMMAEANTYIKNNLPKFEKTNVSKQKFKNQEDRISWMKASFYSSYSLKNNGPADWNRKVGNGRVMKANATTDGAAKKLLVNALKKAKTPEEKSHYENQLQVWDKFKGYHDTYMVYTNDKGHTSIFHISNKKGDNLADPQNNTTPEQRLANFAEAAKEANLNPNSAKIVGKAQEFAMAASADNDNIAKSGYSEIAKNDVAIVSALSNRLPARSDTDVKDEYLKNLQNDGLIKKYYKQKYADKAEEMRANARPEEIIGIAMEIASNTKDISSLSGNFTKFILKEGQLAQSIYAKAKSGMISVEISERLNGIYSSEEIDAILKSPTMKMFADRKAEHAAGLEGVHNGFINALHKADGTKPGENKPNGPAVQTYVAGTLKALHIDTYITNYDDSVLIEMGGYGCKPTELRSCMASLSNFSGEIKTPKGRAALNKHLAENVKVDADSDAVYLLGSNGKTRTYIASDTWRQAGSAKKIATAFGSDLRKCLSNSVGQTLANRNKK